MLRIRLNVVVLGFTIPKIRSINFLIFISLVVKSTVIKHGHSGNDYRVTTLS